MLVRPAAATSRVARSRADLDQALRGTLALELRARRLSRLIEFLDPTRPGGRATRALRAGARPPAGTTPGSSTTPTDSVVAAPRGHALVGFDVTDFLDHELTRAPVTLYLFHLVRQLLDGRRLVCWMDEFWRLLADPAFESFAKDGPEDLAQAERRHVPGHPECERRARAVPSAARSSSRRPTKVFFPNADADADGVHATASG